MSQNQVIRQKTFSVLVENEPGVLSRISGLFSARGYNIVSLTVGETRDPSMSRMTILVEGTPTVLEQVNKQLNKLIPVISVLAMDDEERVSRELMLLKVKSDPSVKDIVYKLAESGKDVKIIEESDHGIVVQIVAWPQAEPEILKHFESLNVIEICRTGKVTVSNRRTFAFLERQQKTLDHQST